MSRNQYAPDFFGEEKDNAVADNCNEYARLTSFDAFKMWERNEATTGPAAFAIAIKTGKPTPSAAKIMSNASDIVICDRAKRKSFIVRVTSASSVRTIIACETAGIRKKNILA
jgi:hypothetical protein